MARKILRYPQISERTGLSLDTLRWLRKQGRGPKTWILANRVVSYEDDVDQWLDQEQSVSTQGGGAA